MPSDHAAARGDAAVLTVVLVVAAGGAVGACLRAAVGDLAPTAEGAFPWPTLLVNVAGSALLALLPALAAVRRRPLLPPLLGTGVLGGFTTLSAWSRETHDLMVAGETPLALAYAAGTLLACLGAVALVDRLATRGQRADFDRAKGDR